MTVWKCELASGLKPCHSELFGRVIETFDFWIWITICDARLARSCQNRLPFQSVIESSVTPYACFSWQKWKLLVSFVLWRNRFNQLSAVAFVVTLVSQLSLWCYNGQSAVPHDVTAVRQLWLFAVSSSSRPVMSALVPGCGPRTRTAGSTGRSTTALPRRRTSSPSIPSPGSSLSPAPSSIGRRPRILNFFLLFYARYSTLLHLPPLRFHCVGGCWDRNQNSCDYSIGSQML